MSVHLCIPFHIYSYNTSNYNPECHISNLKDDYAIFVEDTRSRALPWRSALLSRPWRRPRTRPTALSSPSTPGTEVPTLAQSPTACEKRT